MIQRTAFLMAAFASILVVFSSCDKDETPPKTKTQLLAQGTWKFKSATVSGSDVSGLLQTCQKDNLLTFNTNGNGVVSEGATKCDPADPDSNPFTWTFASAETIINVSSPLFTNGSTSLTLVSLTDTELVVSQAYNPPFGVSLLMTITFQH